MKTALVTGITGQDGIYLTELLLKKNYKVFGISRGIKKKNFFFKKKNVILYNCSIDNFKKLKKIIQKINPDEIYHLAAQSYGFTNNQYADDSSTIYTNIIGTKNIINIANENCNKTKFFFAASSEIYGNSNKFPQNEQTLFAPRSIYGISKITGINIMKYYRQNFNMFSCSGILFNHESPKRGLEFVTRKISNSVARIRYGLQKDLFLGNIKAKRDWGHAKDFANAMWLMLQQKKPKDYVIGTGILHSVEDFLKVAFSHVNLNYKDFVKLDKSYSRPPEHVLQADNKLIKKDLRWKPSVKFKDLVVEMVEHDLKNVKDNLT